MEEAVAEKIYAAEKNVAAIRLVIVLLNTGVFLFLMDRANTVLWLAHFVIVAALIYSLFVYLYEPYRRYSLLLSSSFTSGSDAIFITLWILATGGIDSPFYVLWYASITAIAYRYNYRETLVAAGLYVVSYVVLCVVLGAASGHLTEITVRSSYIFVVAALGGSLAHEAYKQTKDKVALRELVRRLDEEVAERQRVAKALQEREERYRNLFENTTDSIATFTLDGTIISVNRGLEMLLGWSREELIGQHYGKISAPASLARGQERTRRGLAGEQLSSTFEAELIRKDGGVVIVDIQDRFIRNQDGNPVGFQAIFRDITARRRAEEALQDSEERFRLLAEHIRHVFWVMDLTTGRFLYVSPAYEEIWGRSRTNLYADPHDWREGIHPEDRERVLVTLDRQRPYEYDVEYRVVRPDGTVRWIWARGFVIRNDKEEIYRRVGFAEDITERKRTEEQLRTYTAELEEWKSRYDAAIHATGQVLYDWDTRTNTMRWAGETEHMLGYRREELPTTLEGVLEMVHPEDREVFSAEIERVRHTKHPFQLQYRVRRRTGQYITANDRGCFIMERTGQSERMVGFLSDITVQKQAEEAVRESEARYRSLFEHAADGIVCLTAEGLITSVNRGFEALLGWSREEVVGQSYRLFHTPASLRREEERIRRFQVGEKMSAITEVELVHKDGRAVPVEARTRFIRDTTGRPLGVLAVLRDITERKRTEEALRHAKEAAETADRAKSEFLAIMSHEIRTPLNGVIGMTGLLLDTPLTLEQREYAATVRNSAETLLAIINDILDFSKIEAGKLELEVIDFDLGAALEESVELFAHQAYDKGIELAYLLPTDVPTAVRGDPGRLRQILMNLIGNALKFTAKGEVVVRAKLAHDSRDALFLRFEVSDTGIGISPEQCGHLFQAFSQVDASTSRKYGGTGLGLAISKRLVEMMGGTIDVESELGKGSTFWFTVYLEKQPTDVQVARLPPQVNLQGLRVLVIDDNATNRAILHLHCTAWGMYCDGAGDGPQGLTLLYAAAEQGNPYDVALLDMCLPGMDGGEVARAIRMVRDLAALKLVLLTSSGLRGEAKQARDAGINAYLTKPVRPSQLFDCLATVMGYTLTRQKSRHLLPAPPQQVRTAPPNSLPLILIAEDNVVNQKLAVRLLEKLSYRADVVANGLEALEALSRIAYAAVLMDCQMPEMDGFVATREIRLRERTTGTRLPIIAMTANVMQGDRERCLEAGMDDYISKPINIEILKAVLERWTAQQTARSDE